MLDSLIPIAQAVEYLKVCDKTIRRLITRQELTVSKAGKSWRIQKADIDKYLSETRNK